MTSTSWPIANARSPRPGLLFNVSVGFATSRRIFNGNVAPPFEAVEALDDSELAMTLITKIELLRGRHDFVLKAATGEQLLRAEKWLKETEQFLRKTPVIYPDTAAATRFDRLRLMKRLRKIGALICRSPALCWRTTPRW